MTIITRHRWTKDELTHLNRTVAQSKSKSTAFGKIAEEMGLSKTSVAATYYNHHKETPKAKRGPGRPRKTMAEAVPAPSENARPQLNPVQSGRPFDFTSVSERELMEIQSAIKFEITRRIEMLRELEGAFQSA